MLIITSSKSVPKMTSETNDRPPLKLPSIIPEKNEQNEQNQEYETPNLNSIGTTKKLRASKN